MKQLRFLIIIILISYGDVQKVFAQDTHDQREYRKNEVIELNDSLKIEILKWRGEGPSREVDVIYYTVKRQTGKRMWQLATVLFAEENAALIAKGKNPLYKTPEPAKPTIETPPAIVVKNEVIEQEEKIVPEPMAEVLPILKPVREIKGPNPAIKPLKNIEPVIQEEIVATVIDSIEVEIIPAITYTIVIPTFETGERHNIIIGLDSNNNPLSIEDTIAADFITKPYNNLVPPEVIDSFKRDVIYPVPLRIPNEPHKTEQKEEPVKSEPIIEQKKVEKKSGIKN